MPLLLRHLFATICAGGLVALTPLDGEGQMTTGTTGPTAGAPAASSWFALPSGALVGVAVETALYETPSSPHFFLRVRLTNRSARPIGVDLRDRWTTVYPNQWSRGDESARSTVDERVTSPRPFHRARQAQLRADFRAAALARIGPGQSIDYFAEFNASGHANVTLRAGRHVLVTMRGELLATDGVRTEQVALGTSEPARVDLVVPASAPWHTIPPGARVVR